MAFSWRADVNRRSPERGHAQATRDAQEQPGLDHFGQLRAATLDGGCRGDHSTQAGNRGADNAAVHGPVPRPPQSGRDVVRDHAGSVTPGMRPFQVADELATSRVIEFYGTIVNP